MSSLGCPCQEHVSSGCDSPLEYWETHTTTHWQVFESSGDIKNREHSYNIYRTLGCRWKCIGQYLGQIRYRSTGTWEYRSFSRYLLLILFSTHVCFMGGVYIFVLVCSTGIPNMYINSNKCHWKSYIGNGLFRNHSIVGQIDISQSNTAD